MVEVVGLVGGGGGLWVVTVIFNAANITENCGRSTTAEETEEGDSMEAALQQPSN
jgi:hypothetical protein